MSHPVPPPPLLFGAKVLQSGETFLADLQAVIGVMRSGWGNSKHYWTFPALGSRSCGFGPGPVQLGQQYRTLLPQGKGKCSWKCNPQIFIFILQFSLLSQKAAALGLFMIHFNQLISSSHFTQCLKQVLSRFISSVEILWIDIIPLVNCALKIAISQNLRCMFCFWVILTWGGNLRVSVSHYPFYPLL